MNKALESMGLGLGGLGLGGLGLGGLALSGLALVVASSLYLRPTTVVALDEAQATSGAASSTTQSTLPDKVFPRVAGHGGVFPLPEAPQQPRDGTKICVDMTVGSEPDKLSPAIEKLARYLNIYAGAGKQPTRLQLAVIMHGEATLKVLAAPAYAARFSSDGNPNLPLINELRHQGVKFFVCGQSLLSLGAAPGEVATGVEVAVSALTTNVNLQLDGFQIILMH